MLLDKLAEMKKSCTGCSACYNICSADAITMKPDEKGFMKPKISEDACIGCSACEKVCPQINCNKQNDENPKCYAVRNSEEVRKVSASGGAFTALAEYVLDKGGYVCGAAYDDDFRGVSHIMISDKNELYKLRGSKYVYSKPKDIYKQVRDKLKEGAWVLFSGTPCQVAALNNFIKSKQKKLITVDILCGGVPSEEVYKKYMDEISGEKKIVSVNFRPKKYGWNYSGIETKFEDGSEHMIHSMRDPYLRGFMNWLYVNDSCAQCEFAPPARQGDFTMGDFWNLERFFKDADYSDGVSCMLLNNEKAVKIFDEIKNMFAMVKPVPLSFLKRFNRMQKNRAHHLARQRFFALLDRGFSFSKAVDYALGWKFDTALTGCWTVSNYGGELTYYALYKTLQQMGYTTIMVERRADLPNYNIPNPSLFLKNPYPFYDQCRIHKTLDEQRELNLRVANFIVGSDQVWNYRLMQEESIKSYSFDYVAPWRKRISYGTSFGSVTFTGNEEQKKVLGSLLENFDYISVREKSGKEICKNDFGIEAEWVMDPLFLCERKDYESLLQNATSRIQGEYVFTYFLHPNGHKLGIDKFARKLNYGLVNTVNASKKYFVEHDLSKWPYTYEDNCKLENWLYYIVNSKFIITDSFHATCLAIVYKKPFIYIKGHLNDDNGFERLTTILSTFGLMDRVANTVEEALKDEKYFTEIDYAPVHEILERERERSLAWLKNAIEAEKVVEE